MTKRLLTVVFAIVILIVPFTARAHAIGVSRGAYRVDGSDVLVHLALARGELLSAVPALDPLHRGVLDGALLHTQRAVIEARVVAGLVVTGDDVRCVGSLVDAQLTEEDGVALDLRFTCANRPDRVRVELPWIDELSPGHRHFAALGRLDAATHAILLRGQSSFSFTRAVASVASPSSSVLLWMGVEHILTGYDHLVFLIALVLVGGRTRAIVAVITAFTVGHSISLAIAGLGWFVPSPRVIEPAIALSIAYVGVENFFVADADRRFRITFPFGLIHGFGFAGALRAIELPRAEVPRALMLFNLGVELGQLAVLAITLPVIFRLRRREVFRVRVVRGASALVVVAGLVWAVLRLMQPGG